MVIELPPGAVDIAIEVGRIAADRGGPKARAEALLEPLRRAVPFDRSWIAVLNRERTAYVSLASSFSSPHDTVLAGSPAALAGTERMGLHTSTRPVLGAERAIPLWEEPNWARLWPAGFRDEIAVGLHVGGRHMGAMALLTHDTALLDEPIRNLIGVLAPMIAHAVDPMRSVAAAAALVHDAEAGIVLGAGGSPHPLPGLPGHPLLAAGSPVVSVAAARIADGDCRSSFLCRRLGTAAPAGLARISVIGLPPSPVDLSAVVTVSGAGDVCGLTSRELQILGLIVEGWCNRRIADHLLVTVRTVAAHMEHILAKLAARNRTEAAVRAIGRQLYVPAALVTAGPSLR